MPELWGICKAGRSVLTSRRLPVKVKSARGVLGGQERPRVSRQDGARAPGSPQTMCCDETSETRPFRGFFHFPPGLKGVWACGSCGPWGCGGAGSVSCWLPSSSPSLVVGGSLALADVMDRHAWVVWAGAGVLGYVAGEMALRDPMTTAWLGPGTAGAVHILPPVAGFGIALIGWRLSLRIARR